MKHLRTFVIFLGLMLGGTSGGFAQDLDKGLEADRARELRIEVARASLIERMETFAEEGDADAQRDLGRTYYQGRGVPRDYAVAAKWYRLSAEQGDSDAQRYLAMMYSDGQGVPQDHTEAAKWYRLSAEQGNEHAQSRLAYLYYKGLGVPQDFSEAVRRYRLRAEQGDELAHIMLQLIELEISR